MSLASDLGLSVQDVVVLQNANRLAVRLAPANVLARVAPAVGGNEEVAAFELEMARRLEGAQGPVGELAPGLEAIIHRRGGFAITFWRYYDPLPAGPTPHEYACALQDLHVAMRRLDAPAPRFTDRVDEALAIVRDAERSPALADADRTFLVEALRDLTRAILERGAEEQLLHGEPHPGNLLATSVGLRFIDLETCCLGPVEFDIAHAPDEVADHYPAADPLLLRDCRILMLVMVAAWRADRDDDFPNGREKRDELLGMLRRSLLT